MLSAVDRSDQRVALTDGAGYYEFSELPAGTYNLRASSADYVGRQFGLRQLLQGATPLALGKGEQVRNIRLVLTDRITRLTGTVRDENREIVTDRTVVALPANVLLRRPRGRHVRLAYPDLNGQYQIQGLPAGLYLVAAVDEINESDLYEMEILERVASGAVPVLLRQGETTTLDLTAGNPGGAP